MRRRVVFYFIIGAVLLTAGCTGPKRAEQEKSAPQPIPVRTVKLEPQSFSNYLEVTGTLKARNHIDITVEEGGILRKILIDKGDFARKGSSLALLENKLLDASYKQARAALRQAELDFRSKEVLFEKKAISENEYLSSQYALEAAEATYELAKVRLDKLTIVAPISGFVNDRYYDLGAYVSPMTPIFELIDSDHLRVHAGIAERFLKEIRIGTPTEITFDAFPDLVVNAGVSFVARSIDSINRTFEIEVEIPNLDHTLAPHMIANVKILRQRFEDSIVVPLDALVETEEGWFVFVANDNHARKIQVQPLAIHENQVLIEGVEPDQDLIIVGHRSLSDGDPVEVVDI